MEMTETRYVKAGDRHVAYRTIGSGPVELVFLPNWATNVEVLPTLPDLKPMFDAFSSWARVTIFDQPGTGASDPIALDALPSLEQWMDSTSAVVDALGIERAILLAQDAAFQTAALFAATYPDRVTGMAVLNSWARMRVADDYPIGFDEATLRASRRVWLSLWGTGGWQRILNPSMSGTEENRARWAQQERLSASPTMMRVLIDVMFDADIRHILPLIRCPVRVMHRERAASVPLAFGQYIVDNIPDAELSVYPGSDHYLFIDSVDRLDKELRELAGLSSAPAAPSQRVLSTVLFTDIVDSTALAARVGDAEWRRLIDENDRVMAALVEQYGGRLVKSTGDGVLATFDGPARGVRCALEALVQLDAIGLSIRAGLHAGEIEVRGADVAGLGVVIASRVADLGGAGEVLVSSTVRDLVLGSRLGFTARGAHALKGVPDEWMLYAASTA